MPEALWIQATGVDYSAAEDRRLISAMYTPGVVNGLTVAAGVGLSVTVAAGRCVVPDGSGGGYLCYFDTTSSAASLPVSTTVQVWVTVNPTTGLATVGAGTVVPTNPYLVIGGATTSTTGVASVSNVRVMADSPTAPSAKYLPITGGTLTGSAQLAGQRFLVPGVFDASSGGYVSAPNGVMLGGSNPTARHYARAYRDSEWSVASGVWTTLRLTNIDRSASDYNLPTLTTPASPAGSRFVAGVVGDYHLTGAATFEANATGSRRSRIVTYTAAGAQAWTKYCDRHLAGDAGGTVTFDGLLYALQANAYFEFQVYQDSGVALNLTIAAGSSGLMSWGAMRLIQAD